MGRIVLLTRFGRANRRLVADSGLGVAFETHPHTGPRPETWPPTSTGCDSFALRTAGQGFAAMPFLLAQSSGDTITTVVASCPPHAVPYGVFAFWSFVELVRACTEKNLMAVIGSIIKCLGYIAMIWF